MKRTWIFLVLVLAIGTLFVLIRELYAQGGWLPKFTVKGNVWLSADERSGVVIGAAPLDTEIPTRTGLFINESGPEHPNYPRITMKDKASGDMFMIELDTEPHGEPDPEKTRRTTQFYFPVDEDEPNWGMFMRVGSDQEIVFFGDLYAVGGSNIGIGTITPQSPAPNEEVAGNLDANDVYIRAASAGAGLWVSQIAAAMAGPTNGTYAGNGSAAGKKITLAFPPRVVQIVGDWGSKAAEFFKNDSMSGRNAFRDAGGFIGATSKMDSWVSLESDGFTVYDKSSKTSNESGVTYYYTAWP